MTDALEVLDFMDKHSDSDTRTHEAALRSLGRLAAGPKYQEVVGDARFHAILSSLASRLDDCDARTLSMIADASARFRISTPELSDMAQRLAEVVTRREDAFNPRSLANVAIALSIRGVRDVPTVEFIRNEAIKLMDDLEPAHCVMILEAFRRWGVFDRQLVDMVVERMSDEVDRFTARDLVDALAVISRLGLARGFLLRRLCTLAFENLQQFTPRELAKMAYALAKLRFLAQSNIDELADTLAPDLHKLVGSQVSELLYALAMADAKHQLDLARTLVAQYVDSPGGVPAMSGGSLIDVAWSLAALDLVDEHKPEFKAVLNEIFVNRTPPQNRIPLMKLFDVVNALELEYKDLGISVPAAWKAACDDADRFEMDRLETARLHNEIVMRFDNLRGTANGMKWQLRMQRNQTCGPYRVDMLDEETKTALDLEIISWPTSRHLKHRMLENLGYRVLRLQYWDWRRARTEEDQNIFLEREVTKLFEAQPLEAIAS
eukprot:CAMPEP_0197691952 /NCGR_PEP_ID=MMETSP1338-20131121/110436_1 /TAXON_ID=43686 ORGANISM="Pelagodinium beii, Strain RCC1491" /NCGR_SAMPLE_ID=MMETSP1338 /ASSEMBLY_ACC=CAM_ASM_000754 /LENGTH=490 /DNA_ID=CAMNT_0043274561 /DNA_START=131 /DNA_END=1603 /DNA_ORIENTATION=+